MLNDPNWDKKPVLNETSLWLLKAADYIEKYGWWDGPMMFIQNPVNPPVWFKP